MPSPPLAAPPVKSLLDAIKLLCAVPTLAIVVAGVGLSAGCDPCLHDPDDPACPPPPSVAERICDRLAECDRLLTDTYIDCVRVQSSAAGPIAPHVCAECLEGAACEALDDCDADCE